MDSLIKEWKDRLANLNTDLSNTDQDAIRLELRKITLTQCIQELEQNIEYRKGRISEALTLFNEIIDSLQQAERDKLEYKIRFLKSSIIKMFG